MNPFTTPEIENVYAHYDQQSYAMLQEIRTRIYELAAMNDQVGTIEESLKWGQPSYATVRPKSGTPIRLDVFDEQHVAIFVSCQSNLIERLRQIYGYDLEFSKNRAIVLSKNKPLNFTVLDDCLMRALTYHNT